MSSKKNCEEQLAGLTRWLLKQYSKAEVMSMTRTEEAIEKSAKTLLGRHFTLPVFKKFLSQMMDCTTDAVRLSVIREALRAAKRHYAPKVDGNSAVSLNSVAVTA